MLVLAICDDVREEREILQDYIEDVLYAEKCRCLYNRVLQCQRAAGM